MKHITVTAALLALLAGPLGPPATAQTAARCSAVVPCVSVTFVDADIRDVAAAFARVSGYSIVLGPGVAGRVSAAIREQPWDVALQVILDAQGLTVVETHPGILRVDARERLREREAEEPLVTRAFRIHYTPVQELAASLQPLRSPRGSIVASPTTNTLVVTDTEAYVARIAALLGRR